MDAESRVGGKTSRAHFTTLGVSGHKKREKKRKKLPKPPRIDDDAKLSRRVLMDKWMMV